MTLLIHIVVPVFRLKKKHTHISNIYSHFCMCSRHPDTHSDEPKHSCHSHPSSPQHWWHAIPSDMLSLSPSFFSLTVEQKGQLEKESGLQILEAGLSDVSQRKGLCYFSPIHPSPMMTSSFPRVQPLIECILFTKSVP